MATGWGRKTWGASEWGDLSDEIVSVSGISATFSIGSETTTANADVDVSGIQLTSTQGTTVGGTSVLIENPGPVTMSIGVGSSTIGIGVPVSGNVATSSIGAASVDESQLTGIGWGRKSWGNLAWGGAYSVIATGQSLTSSIGSAVASIDVSVSVTSAGQLSSTFGNFSLQIDQDITVFAAEDQLDFTIGSLDFDADANVTVSSAGSLTSSIGTTIAGLKTPVDVSGVQASFTLGSINLVQSTNEQPTGLQGTLTLGQHAEIPGQIIGVSGLQISGSIGQVIVEATAGIDVSGIQMTASVGSPSITAWAEIDPGVSNTWSPVDLAA
jgi:hypothetical protein